MNLARVLAEKARLAPSKVALQFEQQKRTYQELQEGVGKGAALLKTLEIKKGDRIALLLPKGLEFVELYLAALSLGAVGLPLNPGYRPEEIHYFLADSESAHLITTQEKISELPAVLERLPSLGLLLIDPEAAPDQSHPRLAEPIPPETKAVNPHSEDDPALLCYTSGTTGRSKGAIISHGNLIHNMQALDEAWQWSPDDVLLHVLPLFHIHGLAVALHGGLYAGARIVMLKRFDPFKVWETIEKEGCTLFMGVPTMYQRLSRAWDEIKQSPTLPSMRVFISGSAPLPETLFRRFKEQTGHPILERYGMTEAGMICSNPYDPDRRKPKSVGYPLSGIEIKVVDQKGRPVAPGEVGEVWIKGNSVFKGYWRQPQKTQEAFKGAWFKSGDLGYQDPEDGMRLYLKGRIKELIISGGYNVYPKEIETILEEHEAVKEAAVFGLPHEDFGEEVLAAVVLEERSLSQEAVIAYCKTRLAGYKCPKRVFFLESLPRNALGKLQKNVLQQAYQEKKG